LKEKVKPEIKYETKYRVMNSHFLCYNTPLKKSESRKNRKTTKIKYGRIEVARYLNISDSAVSKVFLVMSKKVAIHDTVL